ncbi:MAG TPA: L,D-transpeptidase family protein, partial [Pyrinomonadaceae bacterium]|nr:L,D-transpeptidase family protein [Pyrinomonadaceae bacterium]
MGLGILILLFAFPVVAKKVDSRIGVQTLGAPEVFEAEALLSRLGYWAGPIDGAFDSRSRHALIAFQKVEGRKRTGRLTSKELAALRKASKPLPTQSGYPHIEIDLKRQVLFVVDSSGVISHILPVCSGNEQTYIDHGQVHRAHTPRGRFKITRKTSGFHLSSLGLLYYPNYIYEGIAIHGSWAMAVYPDSHGCIRIPM